MYELEVGFETLKRRISSLECSMERKREIKGEGVVRMLKLKTCEVAMEREES